MHRERLLLIQPRWLPQRAVAEALAAVRREHPGAHLTLLSEAPPPAPDVEHFRLPDLWHDPRPEVLRSLATLRRVRYDEARVLTELDTETPGAAELRFWAFAARAGARRASGTPLRLLEAGNVRRLFRALRARVVRARIEARGRRGTAPVAGRRQQLLAAFMDLERARRILGGPAGFLGLPEEPPGAEMARRQGWSAAGHRADFVRAVPSGPQGLATAADRLAPGGVALVRLTADCPEDRWRPAAEASGLCVISAGPSDVVEGAVDLWLRREAPCTP